jgi:hypothetical protein
MEAETLTVDRGEAMTGMVGAWAFEINQPATPAQVNEGPVPEEIAKEKLAQLETGFGETPLTSGQEATGVNPDNGVSGTVVVPDGTPEIPGKNMLNPFRSSRVGRTVTKAAVVAVSIYGASALAPTPGKDKAGPVNSALELVAPDEARATFLWENVGGDPLFSGGVSNIKEAQKAFVSRRGTTTLRLMGYNERQRRLIQNDARRGDVQPCTIPKRTRKMAYSAGTPIVVNDVILTDPDYPNGLPGYCITVRDRFRRAGRMVVEKIKVGIAKPCANLNEIENEREQQTILKKPEVKAGKVFEDGQGVRLPFLPGVVVAEWRCGKNGEFIPVKLYEPTQVLGRCAVGRRITVREAYTLGGDGMPQPLAIDGQPIPNGAHWILKTPRSVTRAKMPKTGFTARFKNIQVSTIPIPPEAKPIPTPIPPPPKRVTLTGRGDVFHRYAWSGYDPVCVDPDPHPEGRWITVGNFRFWDTTTGAPAGQVRSNEVYILPGTYDVQCVDWRPFGPQSVTWGADMNDDVGNKGNHVDEIPVVGNQNGG